MKKILMFLLITSNLYALAPQIKSPNSLEVLDGWIENNTSPVEDMGYPLMVRPKPVRRGSAEKIKNQVVMPDRSVTENFSMVAQPSLPSEVAADTQGIVDVWSIANGKGLKKESTDSIDVSVIETWADDTLSTISHTDAPSILKDGLYKNEDYIDGSSLESLNESPKKINVNKRHKKTSFLPDINDDNQMRVSLFEKKFAYGQGPEYLLRQAKKNPHNFIFFNRIYNTLDLMLHVAYDDEMKLHVYQCFFILLTKTNIDRNGPLVEKIRWRLMRDPNITLPIILEYLNFEHKDYVVKLKDKSPSDIIQTIYLFAYIRMRQLKKIQKKIEYLVARTSELNEPMLAVFRSYTDYLIKKINNEQIELKLEKLIELEFQTELARLLPELYSKELVDTFPYNETHKEIPAGIQKALRGITTELDITGKSLKELLDKIDEREETLNLEKELKEKQELDIHA